MNKLIINILFLSSLIFHSSVSYSQNNARGFEFYGNSLNFPLDDSLAIDYNSAVSDQSIAVFYNSLNGKNYRPLVDSLISYRDRNQLNDWIYYQLIRKAAEQISPKAENYERYTLYKWFLLAKSGYDATLGFAGNKLLFYVRSDDDISDIPFYVNDNKQYICLNYHDYGKTDFENNRIQLTRIPIPEAKKTFSYQVTRLPDFKPEDYTDKKLDFNYGQKSYHFSIKLNPQVENIFANYPVVDFGSYFNIPLSRETYRSLIPALRQNVKGMNQKKGVDYLMQFTRNAFLYEDDDENFGKEKRLSPEQTLFSEHSDCDDRVALFFYLVKEIYNLPMIAMLYPTHITMAVQFDKPVGKSILYDGKKYSVCEPTPQLNELKIGELPARYQNLTYQIVYQYNPATKR